MGQKKKSDHQPPFGAGIPGAPASVENCRRVQEIVEQGVSAYDPLGSYTGKPTHRGEKPVQDADDL